MRIDSIRSAGIIVNYQCSAACRHCCYASSPNWVGDYMDDATALKIAYKLTQHRCMSCHIGGGEPFLNFRRLVAVCRLLTSKGIAIEYIETNCSWHTNDERTAHMLEELLAAGIDCLLISADPFHNEYVPYEKTLSVIRICQRMGMGTFVWPGTFHQDLMMLDISKTHTLEEYAQTLGTNYTAEAVTKYGLTPNGRAIKLYADILPRKTAEQTAAASPCRNLTHTGHCHIDLYYHFIPPGCTGLKLPVDAIDDEIDPQIYPVMTTLYQHGLSALLIEAKDLGFVPSSAGYVHKCHLCMELKRFMLTVCSSHDLGYPRFFEESL